MQFLYELGERLSGARHEVIVLAAELLTLNLLPLDGLSAASKAQRVEAVLARSPLPVVVPSVVLEAFAGGLWGGRRTADSALHRWFADAVEFVSFWGTLSQDQQDRGLRDPLMLAELVYRSPAPQSLQHALLYFCHPNDFLPLRSRAHKIQVRDAYAHLLSPSTGDLDRDLVGIVRRLEDEQSMPVRFYQPQWQRDWRPPHRPLRNAPLLWRVLAPADRERQARWRERGVIEADLPDSRRVLQDANRPLVAGIVDDAMRDAPYDLRAQVTNTAYALLSQVAAKDRVLVDFGDKVWLGSFGGTARHSHGVVRRQVRWARSPFPREAVPDNLLAGPELLAPCGQRALALVEEMMWRARPRTAVAVAEARAVESPAAEEPPKVLEVAQVFTEVEQKPTFRSASAELADDLNVDRDWLQEMIDLLQQRRQLVFYGPSGTGKTFVAEKLAYHIAGPDAVRIVQLHPSYAYEDLFEGFRPVEQAQTGTVGYQKRDGPLRDIARNAAARPAELFVLVLDELNRGNLAKVFGELYYLLDKRDHPIRLQYSPDEEFRLPPNVLLIGTMNSTDVSITAVDSAIRRRFPFVELHPDEMPVRGVLSRWALKHGRPNDERVLLLQELNDTLGPDAHDIKIGPSYLMRSDLDDPAALERVWRYDLLPLLEEHFHRRMTRVELQEKYGLAAIRAKIADRASTPAITG
ncbi:AAA family ATPase [Plantactinospora sp. BB1]|uniref:AAA family ATPase n=1 Tax=Plantactinospora sp. BB1 TaxID=2071627 RepID=UPI001F168202|nr:AAA family ATPase [Plantactinospora sp. BB1]